MWLRLRNKYIYRYDLLKAFDTVPHQRLFKKLQYYDINNNTYYWISSWVTKQTQRVLVNGSASNYIPVAPGVSQGAVLGPLMFLIYINDINKNHHHYAYLPIIALSVKLFTLKKIVQSYKRT